MQTIRKYTDKVIEYICISFIAIMTTLVTWQVITRYFFKSPNAYTEQICKYMFIWLVLLASAYVFGKKEHMSIVFLREKFTGRAAVKVNIIIELIVIIFAIGVLVVGGFNNTLLTMGQSDSVLPITIGMIYMMLPISGLLTVMYSICNIMDILNGKLEEEDIKSE
ncbi:TRAP transporter small permease [Clostridium lacusfryxellense]|uniref:TRAP transporter small permease n=1 Tax=Clostridium lacusfryxellense TaxID=205328 RepID=UPI001C0C6AAB|nr:TRAP transporter small permease [Clostridium lacusfryxellense]MBU3113948.1 TRAP transporter small permease [Clostridium lacusfryxellense]